MAPLASPATPIYNGTLGKMRTYSGIQFRALGAATGVPYSKICLALLGKAELTPEEQRRVERVLVSALRKRQREIEALLRSAPMVGD
jgi:hypothetical protein